ncbi:MAG: fasciclin domain-containing protein [Lutibacter sp.]|uniref:fasciclin domain-containing protein n=1 Tax=Lutibacter sp. TaxID=1925666 RepID=UPI00184A1E45|nr:fasciclin domain-containing protein [Lutibacter sp.]MBT8317280.1 fasciclin domain-containing protein [Lutibacter sp.]NNJ58139.1 fasciclin domain-containing protein [Lutibacter sp.]
MITRKNLKATLIALTLFITFSGVAQDKNIVETAVATDDFSTLVAAVTAADLVDVLSSEGPFTVFAPTNAAFNKLPEGTLESLLKPESKKTLQTILTYHVVAGNVKAADLIGLIKKNNGKAMVKTVSGNMLTAQLKDGAAYLVDEAGNWSKITATDVNTSNGVIHIIDTVVLPKM